MAEEKDLVRAKGNLMLDQLFELRETLEKFKKKLKKKLWKLIIEIADFYPNQAERIKWLVVEIDEIIHEINDTIEEARRW